MLESFPEQAIVEGGIILVDKPKGVSSFKALDLLRKYFAAHPIYLSICTNNQIEFKDSDLKLGHAAKTSKLKLGHAGTLDPNATGLLIVGVGKGTKKLKDYVGLDKTYEAEILLGVKTDTGDIEGIVVETVEVEGMESENISEVVSGLEGKQVLPVPIYSAVKQGGEPMYKKAREGKKLVRHSREMEIKQIKVESIKKKEERVFVGVEMNVSSGTYVRSIAEEIGRRLGVPATLSELRRIKVGEFDVRNSIKLSVI